MGAQKISKSPYLKLLALLVLQILREVQPSLYQSIEETKRRKIRRMRNSKTNNLQKKRITVIVDFGADEFVE